MKRKRSPAAQHAYDETIRTHPKGGGLLGMTARLMCADFAANEVEKAERATKRGVVVRGSSGHVRVLEELCNDDRCGRHPDTHWHAFSVEDFLKESAGEYTVTLRVRVVGRKPRSRRKVS